MKRHGSFRLRRIGTGAGSGADDLLRLMAEEYTFVTRPVIVRGDRATAGFSTKRVDELVG